MTLSHLYYYSLRNMIVSIKTEIKIRCILNKGIKHLNENFNINYLV